MRRLLVIAVFLGLALPLSGQYQYANPSNVIGSTHDFSMNSPANIKATNSTETCTFCHTPHKANPAVPLWNHKMSQGVTYQVYQSSTIVSEVMQPTVNDSSLLCLSCHDGTVALGDTVNNGMIPFQNVTGSGTLPPSSQGYIGTDLTSHHPVAFVPNVSQNNQILLPPQGDPVKLDAQGKVQCTACHEPHTENRDPVEKRFLAKNNSSSAICVTCHRLAGGVGSNPWSWSGTQGLAASHEQATNTYNLQTNDGIPWLGSHTGYNNVNTNGCEACHRPHTAHEAQRLLKGETDQVCFQCHDGNPLTALLNLQQEFTKLYIHPSIGPQPGHDPAEAPNNITTRHAACDDCHNTHAVRANTGPVVPPQLSALLFGLSGVSLAGVHDPRHGSGDAQAEYEVCFKCHGASPNQPQQPGYNVYGPLPIRVLRTTDLSQVFASLVTAHPVARPGLGVTIPSLLPYVVDASGSPITSRPLTTTSQISCSDCHNNDTGRNLGPLYTGPIGAHGSNIIHLLERTYLIETPNGKPGNTPNVPYVSSNYAMCYKCHSETTILSSSSWPGHLEHTGFSPCATCHEPHGVANGTQVNNSSLIDFDQNIVAPGSNGQLQYTRTATFTGSCSLLCHGQDHANKGY